MDVALQILVWLCIGLLGILTISFLSGFILALLRLFRPHFEKQEGGKRIGKLLEDIGEVPGKLVRSIPLHPSHVFLIGTWYLLNLALVVFIAYSFISEKPMEILSAIQKSNTALFLVQCFCLGTIGATMYGILQISRFELTEKKEWLLRRYFFLPLLGGFLGAISYFFVHGSMISLQGTSLVNGRANVSSYAVYVVAFLTGFASRELTAKLISISRAIFTKVKEEDI
ncbi:MAG: hypothetical protein JSW40_06625 [Candidatus Omnitrophota bacterium]|nr:MAG: hypothetical protein JSW40_06625 [Candidatus Omnitrophota bacterium]